MPLFSRPLRRLALLAALLAGPAASATENDSGLWLTTQYSHALSEPLTAHFALQPRLNNDGKDLERLLLRPWLHYRLNRKNHRGPQLSLAAGYDYHAIRAPTRRREQRLWQQAAATTAIGSATGLLQLRLEERFIENVDEDAYRLRLKLGLSRPLGAGDWQAVFSNEVLVGLNEASAGADNRFDQNRLYMGLRRALSARLSVELGYQHHYVERPVEDLSAQHVMISLSFR